MKVFSKEELARNNGENGAPVYIAHRGIVYEVSKSPLWGTGSHQGMHEAGRDLTDDLESMAPHGTEVLGRYPKIGTLSES
jgi:predicted heme/steroid binding protein